MTAASALAAPASNACERPVVAPRRPRSGNSGKPRLDGRRHVRTDGVVRGAQSAPLERVARVEALFLQPDAPQELEPAAPQELVDDDDHEVGPRDGSIQ